MMTRYILLFVLASIFLNVNGQSVEVQADYDAMGNCIFGAHNNSNVPVYLHINFADLENTSFSEPLPYVKRLTPGFNSLFMLERYPDAGVPRFNYEVKTYRSDPLADVNLDFPYLIPFGPGSEVEVFDVKNIDGFWGDRGLDSWSASGFKTKPGEKVYASRNGMIVEVVGGNRASNPQGWYNTWTYAVTVLQPDGTLMCYHNVIDRAKTLKPGEKIYAGQLLGEVAPGTAQLVVLIYHHSLSSKGLRFVIPQFVVGEGKTAIVNSATTYTVVHPLEIRGLEMSKKERKKILGRKK